MLQLAGMEIHPNLPAQPGSRDMVIPSLCAIGMRLIASLSVLQFSVLLRGR
jgi:hypothetical protein